MRVGAHAGAVTAPGRFVVMATRRRSDSSAVRRVSAKEVAAAAGCSTATVSRALNGMAVSPEVSARVAAAVQRLGYVRDLSARSLRARRTQAIGIVVNLELHPGTEVLTLLGTMVRMMDQHHYSTTVSFLSEGVNDLDQVLRGLAERRVDGVFVWNAQPVASLDLYRKAHVPVIAIAGRDPSCADLPLVTTDSARPYGDLFRRLHRLGHRRIAEITAENSHPFTHSGFAAAAGLRWERLLLGFADQDARTLLQDVMRRRDRPTTLLTSYPTAVQLMVAADELGLRVPDDLSLISQTESAAARLLRIPLTTVTTDFERLGVAASDLMLSALGGRVIGDVVLEDAVTWTERASIGRAPRRRAASTAV